MNTNKFVFSVIAVVVALVMLGSCLVPVVTSAIDGEPVTKTLNNTITGSKSVYRMVSGDTILTEVSAGDFSITSGANTYTTTDQVILVDPDYGLFVPSFDDHNVTIYSNNGITTIDSELGYSVDKIYVGPRTTFFIDSGKLYGMGQNNKGQQGNGTTTDVTTPTQVATPLSYGDIQIYYTDSEITIMSTNIEGQETVYLVSSISELNDHLYVVEDTEGYYAAPSSLVSYNFDASSFYVGTGSTVDRSYGVNVTITKNTGSDTILSSGYGVYLYDNGTAPLTINGFSGLYAIVEESYSGTVQEGGVGEGSLFAILLTLTVTLTIIGVVIGIVRRIGGEDY